MQLTILLVAINKPHNSFLCCTQKKDNAELKHKPCYITPKSRLGLQAKRKLQAISEKLTMIAAPSNASRSLVCRPQRLFTP